VAIFILHIVSNTTAPMLTCVAANGFHSNTCCLLPSNGFRWFIMQTEILSAQSENWTNILKLR